MNAMKVLIVTGKGGVGKTTIAVNMAVHWAQEGQKVGLLDADIHCPTIPRMLGIKPQGIKGLAGGIEPASPMEGLKVVSMALFLQNQEIPITWRGPIKHGVIKQFISESHWGTLDFLVVDLPAGTGDEAMSAVHLLREGVGALIVTTPQLISLWEARRTISFFRQHQVPIIGLVENMVDLACPYCEKSLNPFGEGGGEHIAMDLDIPFLGRIPLDPEVARCGDTGDPCIVSSHHVPAADALREIGQRCMASMEKRVPFTLITKIVYT